MTTRPVTTLSRKVTMEYTKALLSVLDPISSAVTLSAVTMVIELPAPIRIATVYITAALLPAYSVTIAARMPIIAPNK